MRRDILGSGPVAPVSKARGCLIPSRLRLAVFVGVVGTAAAAAGEAVPKSGDGASFSGRVIEVEGGKPVAGATVVVSRTMAWRVSDDLPAWVGDTTLRTDADGRFTVAFSADQVAEPGLLVTLARVAHPDFVPRKGWAVPLRTILQGRRFGDKPFFDTVALERGMEYSGQVVTPEGRPAADVPYEFQNWSARVDSEHFSNETMGRTDADGRFKLRMSKTQWLTIMLIPESYAPYRRFWGTAEPAKNPDVWPPSDLGRLVLEGGTILTGRLLDLQARPIAGQRVVALGRQNGSHRTATTQANGSFTFAPLRPGNYDVFAEGQLHGGGIDPTAQSMPMTAPVVRPADVFWKSGEAPPRVELRELPMVAVEVRFVDAQGQPARGSLISLSGRIPSDEKKEGFTGTPFRIISAAAIGEPEVEDMGKQLGWGCQLAPDATGRVRFRAPKGLIDASLNTYPADETVAYKTRLVEGGPLKFWGGGRLGMLDTDRKGISIIVYRAPTVLVTIKTEGGEPVPADAKVEAGFDFKGFAYGGNVIRQADGRIRSQSLMPDHEYEFDAWGKGYVPKRLQRVNLPEGGTTELTLVIRKKPALPEAGAPAPPFSVVTLDGRRLDLEGFRGKFVLLHFWGPFHRDDRDLPGLRALHDRFGGDNQFAMLGLCLATDPDAATRAIKDNRLTWAQVLMADRSVDPIAMDYLCNTAPVPSSFLIDPDGLVLDTRLGVADAEKWLIGVLGER